MVLMMQSSTSVASGGTGDLQYSIDNGNSWQESPEFLNVEPGSFDVIVQDENGCQTVYADNPVEITNPLELVINDIEVQNPTCYGAYNGQISITGEGGTGMLSYSIDGGITWQAESIFAGLNASEYVVSVKDENNCITDFTNNPVVLTSPPQIVVDANITHVSCYGEADGMIEIIADGGTGSLMYTIGDGWQDSPVFEGLAPGSYTVMVEDENGCLVPYPGNSAIITQPEPLFIENVETINPQCSGEEGGSIIIFSGGGTGDHQYSIDGGETWQASGTFEMLEEGEYEVVVSDENDCYTSYSENPVIISDPEEIEISDVLLENITCYGQNDGLIEITAEGGTGMLQYSIDDGQTWQDDNLFADLIQGQYNILVMDENECNTFYENNPVEITEPSAVAINEVVAEDITCYGGSDGSIEVDAEGGTGALMYSIDNGSNYQPNNVFTGLSAGEYNVMVHDENECQETYASNPVILSEPEPLEVTITVEPDDVVCADQIVTLTAEASEEATFSWEPSGQTGSSIEVDSTGIGVGSVEYTVTATTEQGCTTQESITITFTDCTGISAPANDNIDVTVHPNPTKGDFQISIEGEISDFDIECYDATGSLIMKKLNQVKEDQKYESSFNFTGEHSGIYYLRIIHQDGIIVKKLIISN
ncbi:MAG: T9SS type A sorting domain-containing protein [Bacteroidales bacterium]|nr:T9SS type A sorting domain-containing protein [Bacteroidales bacterium]